MRTGAEHVETGEEMPADASEGKAARPEQEKREGIEHALQKLGRAAGGLEA